MTFRYFGGLIYIPCKWAYKDKNQWNMSEGLLNTLAMILFLIVFVILLGTIHESLVDVRARDLSVIIFDLVIISLATYRMIRFLTYDKVTRFVRVWSDTEKGTVRRTIHELLICPWCSGVWSALAVAFLYYFSLGTWFLTLVLAVAGVGVAVHAIVRRI